MPDPNAPNSITLCPVSGRSSNWLLSPKALISQPIPAGEFPIREWSIVGNERFITAVTLLAHPRDISSGV